MRASLSTKDRDGGTVTPWLSRLVTGVGEFFIHLADVTSQAVEPGHYTAELCVEGRDVTATTARLEFTCTLPRSLTMQLLTDGDS